MTNHKCKRGNLMDFIAHISENNERIQTVREHIFETARLCSEFGKDLCIENICYLSGLLHDIGKLTQDFTDYIQGKNNYSRGEIDHAFAGAKYLFDFVSAEFPGNKMTEETAKLISRVIISHHGIHDWFDKDGNDYFNNFSI